MLSVSLPYTHRAAQEVSSIQSRIARMYLPTTLGMGMDRPKRMQLLQLTVPV